MIGSPRFRQYVLAVTSLFAAGNTAVAQPAPPAAPFNPAQFQLFCPNAITQNFPTAGPAETTWMICWREVAGNNSIADRMDSSSVRSIFASRQMLPLSESFGTCGCLTTSFRIILEVRG